MPTAPRSEPMPRSNSWAPSTWPVWAAVWRRKPNRSRFFSNCSYTLVRGFGANGSCGAGGVAGPWSRTPVMPPPGSWAVGASLQSGMPGMPGMDGAAEAALAKPRASPATMVSRASTRHKVR